MNISAMYATTVTDQNGKFHPAVAETGYGLRYWPHIIFASEQEAYESADLTLKDLFRVVTNHIQQWNVVKSETGHTVVLI